MESTEFRAARAEGVRDALAVVEALLAAEEPKRDLPASYVTRAARRTQWQAYRNAASRLRTKLTRIGRGTPVAAGIEVKLKRWAYDVWAQTPKRMKLWGSSTAIPNDRHWGIGALSNHPKARLTRISH